SFELIDGEYHAIRIEKAGYETALERLKPEDRGPLPRVVLVAETVPRGTVFVESNAPAEVWVDGQPSGFMTPTPGLRVGPGRHRRRRAGDVRRHRARPPRRHWLGRHDLRAPRAVAAHPGSGRRVPEPRGGRLCDGADARHARGGDAPRRLRAAHRHRPRSRGH